MHYKRGTLTIFTSYAPGAGKTFAMISCAIKHKEKGASICIGYLNAAMRPETMALANKLADTTNMLFRTSTSTGTLDIDSIINEGPDYCVVDELMFKNRITGNYFYQDICDLLNRGISVLASVSMLRLPSINEKCAKISGICAKTTLPLSVLQMAEKVFFIDVDPEKLVLRYRQKNFFRSTSAAWNCYVATEALPRYRNWSLDFLMSHEGLNYEIIKG